jgi:hypothetical protein
VERLRDRRGRRVVFLAHCLLNENTRYLGGACRPGAVGEVVRACLAADLGIVQLPCPEQRAWGGVLKRWLLAAYGLRERAPWAYALRGPLLALWLRYTRWAYARLATRIAADAADYAASGYAVVGVVGVDGSPPCGVARSIDLRRVDALLTTPVRDLTVARVNAILRRATRPSRGLFTAALDRALTRRGLTVPQTAHDLFAELEGGPVGAPQSVCPAAAPLPTPGTSRRSV